MIVEHGTDRTFTPFNRVAMLDWEREPVPALLERFRSARAPACGSSARSG